MGGDEVSCWEYGFWDRANDEEFGVQEATLGWGRSHGTWAVSEAPCACPHACSSNWSRFLANVDGGGGGAGTTTCAEPGQVRNLP